MEKLRLKKININLPILTGAKIILLCRYSKKPAQVTEKKTKTEIKL